MDVSIKIISRIVSRYEYRDAFRKTRRNRSSRLCFRPTKEKGIYRGWKGENGKEGGKRVEVRSSAERRFDVWARRAPVKEYVVED